MGRKSDLALRRTLERGIAAVVVSGASVVVNGINVVVVGGPEVVVGGPEVVVGGPEVVVGGPEVVVGGPEVVVGGPEVVVATPTNSNAPISHVVRSVRIISFHKGELASELKSAPALYREEPTSFTE